MDGLTEKRVYCIIGSNYEHLVKVLLDELALRDKQDMNPSDIVFHK